MNWIGELSEAAEIVETHDQRMEPGPRLFSRTPESWVREFDYDNRVEDQLLRLVQQPFAKNRYEPARITVGTRRSGRLLNLFLGEDRLEVEITRSDHPIGEYIRDRCSVVPDQRRIVLYPYDDGVTAAVKVLATINDLPDSVLGLSLP